MEAEEIAADANQPVYSEKTECSFKGVADLAVLFLDAKTRFLSLSS